MANAKPKTTHLRFRPPALHTPPLPPVTQPELWAAILLAVGALVGFHHIEVLSGLDMQIGGGADPRLIHTLCEHWLQVFRGQAQVASPHIFFPQTGTLGYTDALLGHGLLYAMARGLGAEMFVAYDFLLVSVDALNVLAMIGLLRYGLRLRLLPSVLGAVLLAFNSAKFAQIGHVQLQLLFPLPLALWALIACVRQPKFSWRTPVYGALFGGCLALELWSSYYNGWFFAFWLLILGIALAFQRETRAAVLAGLWHHWVMLPVAGLVLYKTLLPFAAIYQPVAEQLGWRSYEEVSSMLPQPFSYVSMGDQAVVWGWLAHAVPQFAALPTPWEHRMGIGLVPWLALVVTLAMAVRGLVRKNATAADRWLLTVGVATLVLLLLPIRVGDASLWRWFYDNFPGARAVRSVTRVILVAMLPIAGITAALADRALARVEAAQNPQLWRGLFVVVLLLATVEQARHMPGHVPAEERSRIAEIASQVTREKCPAFVVRTSTTGPETEIDLQTMAMLAAMQTGVPTLNGYSGKYPYGWDLEKMRAPGYPDRIREWRARSGLRTSICVAWVR